MTVAIDHRCLVRIWNRRNFDLISQRRTEEGDRPIDTVKALLAQAQLGEAVATADWLDGSRWSGFVYLNQRSQIEVIHHGDVEKIVEWPEWDNRGPTSPTP